MIMHPPMARSVPKSRTSTLPLSCNYSPAEDEIRSEVKIQITTRAETNPLSTATPTENALSDLPHSSTVFRWCDNKQNFPSSVKPEASFHPLEAQRTIVVVIRGRPWKGGRRRVGCPETMSESVPHDTVKLDAHAFVNGFHMVVPAGERDLVGTIQVLGFESSRPVTEVDLSDRRSRATVDVRVGNFLNVLLVGELVLWIISEHLFMDRRNCCDLLRSRRDRKARQSSLPRTFRKPEEQLSAKQFNILGIVRTFLRRSSSIASSSFLGCCSRPVAMRFCVACSYLREK